MVSCSEEGHAPEQAQRELKYLDFVRLAAVRAVVCLSRPYGYAKESSGPLKPGLETVEGIVRSVIGPVYDKFHGVPYELLKFVDRKVGELLSELDQHLPSAVKEASSQAHMCS